MSMFKNVRDFSSLWEKILRELQGLMLMCSPLKNKTGADFFEHRQRDTFRSFTVDIP